MKIKIIRRIIVISSLLIIIMQISTLANTLTLKLTSNKAQYQLNDKIIITVNWMEKMQAASYTIKYDSDKLKFESSNIADTFYSIEKER